jgi:predicted GIY-YIG superfamily endonuclease
MATFHNVYTLVSAHDPNRRYIGLTDNFESRLISHNAGQVPHTAKISP